MTQAGEDFFQTAIHTTPAGVERSRARIALVYGAGSADEVFFSWRGERLYQLPVVWLHPQGRWGHISYNRYGKGDFSRNASPRCLECHNTWVGHVAGTPNRYTPQDLLLGVTCERCHGPGREHVAFHRAHPGAETGHAVVHPGRLTRERQLEVCTQCHGNASRRRGPAFSYRPGEPLESHFRTSLGRHPEDDHVANQIKYLRQSKCFQRSDALTCTTCHNPHRPHGPAESLSVKNACLKCHQPASCGERGRLPAAVRDSCVSCHMPQRVWMNVHFHTEEEGYVPPATRHEHRIAVHPVARQEVLLAWHRSRSGAAGHREAARLTRELVEHWLAVAEGYRREYRFLASIGAAREALRVDPAPATRTKLNELVAIQASLEGDMVEAQHLIDGRRFPEAIALLKKTLAVKPDLAEAHGKLGTVYAISGQNELAAEHLRAVARCDPDDAYGHSMLGWLAYLRGEAKEAAEAFRRADEIQPFNAKINYHWGLALARLGRLPEATQCFRRVVTIDPRHAGGHQGLSHVLRLAGRPEEAVRSGRRASQLTRFRNADVLVTLAEAYAAAGRFADAEKAATRALEAARAGSPDVVRQIRRRLEELRTRAGQAPR
jgi:tetratricopeptide (TPR) repeat protein